MNNELIEKVTKLIESKSYRVYRNQKSELIINLVEQSQWVKASDRMPENESILCMIYVRDDHEFGWWHEGTGCWDSPDLGYIEKNEVTWWQPISNPPEL